MNMGLYVIEKGIGGNILLSLLSRFVCVWMSGRKGLFFLKLFIVILLLLLLFYTNNIFVILKK